MKRLVILGAGESGVGTALLGKEKGYDVFVSDKGKIKKKYKEVLIHNEIEWEEEKHTESKILNADVVMKSPGIPDKVALVQKLLANNIYSSDCDCIIRRSCVVNFSPFAIFSSTSLTNLLMCAFSSFPHFC